MAVAFINRAPTNQEIERWRLIMSTFNDGSGQERDADGGTRLGWRDIERVAAVMLFGEGGENKQIFDVLVSDPAQPDKYYGISVKSKELSKRSIEYLSGDGRIYMELCNSPAKLWDPLKLQGITEADFTAGRHAEQIGKQVLATVESWDSNFAQEFNAVNPGKTFSLSESIYLTVSYNKAKSVRQRVYQIHSFQLHFPTNIQWKYSSARCLRGYDPDHPTEALFDWYGLSGGQLKYYPRACTAKYASTCFSLIEPRVMSLEEKAGRYFPDQWINAGGTNVLTSNIISEEMLNLAKLFGATEVATVLRTTALELPVE